MKILIPYFNSLKIEKDSKRSDKDLEAAYQRTRSHYKMNNLSTDEIDEDYIQFKNSMSTLNKKIKRGLFLEKLSAVIALISLCIFIASLVMR